MQNIGSEKAFLFLLKYTELAPHDSSLAREARGFKSHLMYSWAYWDMKMAVDFKTGLDFSLLIYPEK